MSSQREHSAPIAMAEQGGVLGEVIWLTARQAAVYTSLSVSMIRKACRRQELQHIRLGRANGPIRTRTEWVDAWMVTLEQSPASHVTAFGS